MTKADSKDLKILISCHKEITLPKSDIYLPVHVGAANAPCQFPNMQPDNEGENISDRNFTFCELTAQYWAWKNLEASYVGLCHYRRFFCFDGKNYPTNDHHQIEADALSEYSIRDFSLDDANHIRSVVSHSDLVTAPYWDVSKTIAPGGVKGSVAEHMIAYGLFEQADLDTLRSIVAERQPKFLPFFDSYVNGKKYLGYSCYVMKRELFDQLCEFEFDILLSFDKQFDYEYLTTTRKRICGYFGEILYSVFVEYLRNEGKVKIKQVPLVFFFDTSVDPFESVPGCQSVIDVSGKEENLEGKKTIEVVWRYRDFSTSAFLAGIQSFIDHVDPKHSYRITVLHEENFVYPNFEIALPSIPENVVLRHAHWTEVPVLEDWSDLSIEELDIVEPVLLPWFVSNDDPLFWIDGLGAFAADPAAVFDSFAKDDSAYSALQNILLQREINKPENKSIADSYSLSTRRPCFADSTVMCINPTLAKERFSISQIADIFRTLKTSYYASPSPKPHFGEKRKTNFKLPFYTLENQAFRSLLLDRLEIKTLPFELVSVSTHYSDTLDWANALVAADWKAATQPTFVYCEYGRVPLMDESYRFASAYWKAARSSKAYEVLLGEIFDPNTGSTLGRLLPAGTKRGQMARRIFKRVKG